MYPTGDARIDEVLQPHLRERVEGAALLGDEPAVIRLLGGAPGPGDLNNALAGAAKGGHAALCRRLLDGGASVNITTGADHVTPLMRAACSGSHETIELLLKAGADVLAKNANGTTALHMAVWYGAESRTIELLLRSGASPQIEAANNHGYTPLAMAQEKGREEIVRLLREWSKNDSH
jgi:ankyrin repeat protein